MDNIIIILKSLNLVVGVTTILTGLDKYISNPSRNSPLYISSAIIIVGPVEDILNNQFVTNLSSKDQEAYELIDQITSLIFLILMSLVVKEV